MTWREPVPPDDYLENEECEVSNSGDQVALLFAGIASFLLLLAVAAGLIWIISHVIAWIWP
jgi:hypothetical protein